MTGFSFGDKALTSMDDGSEEFLNFLIKFFQLYPDLKQNEFYLTGESYAGKYLPIFTKRILEHNKKTPSINLQATVIIDPYPSPVIQRTNMHILPHAAGFIDDNNLEQLETLI